MSSRISEFEINHLYKVIQKNGHTEIISIELLSNERSTLRYLVNSDIIVEFAKYPSEKEKIRTTVALYRHYSNIIPTAKVSLYDESKKIVPMIYAIYEKPKGDPICKIWNSLSVKERKKYVHEAMGYVRTINQNPPSIFQDPRFTIDYRTRSANLKRLTNQVLRSSLSSQMKNRIKKVIRQYLPALKEEILVPTYKVFKLDYVFVDEGVVTGLIGLDNLVVTSNDYILESIYRIASDFLQAPFSRCYADQKVKHGFELLPEWVEDVMPELFQHQAFDKRVTLYLLERSLKLFLKYPTNEGIIEELQGILDLFE